MPTDRLVPVRPNRPPARRDATHVHALRYASRVAARPRPGGRWGRALGVVLVGILATITIVGFMSILAFNAAVGVLSVGLPDPARLQSLTFAQPTVIYDR